jgi:hypothetical protein
MRPAKTHEPSNSTNALSNEPELVVEQGMDYVHKRTVP